MLYDFSKMPGDTVSVVCRYDIVDLVIDSIVIKNIEGINRRHLYLHSVLFPLLSLYWIEGIGNPSGFLANAGGCGGGFHPGLSQIICVRQNNAYLYGTQCLLKHPNRIPDQNSAIENIRIASNPVLNSEIEILNPDRDRIQWQLFSPQGLLLAKGNHLKIQVAKFTDGIFFCRFAQENILLYIKY